MRFKPGDKVITTGKDNYEVFKKGTPGVVVQVTKNYYTVNVKGDRHYSLSLYMAADWIESDDGVDILFNKLKQEVSDG